MADFKYGDIVKAIIEGKDPTVPSLEGMEDELGKKIAEYFKNVSRAYSDIWASDAGRQARQQMRDLWDDKLREEMKKAYKNAYSNVKGDKALIRRGNGIKALSAFKPLR